MGKCGWILGNAFSRTFFQPPGWAPGHASCGALRTTGQVARPLAAGRAQAAADPARLIISHGGSHDSLAHWRALESSAKPFRYSDRGEPLSSREKFGAGMCLGGRWVVAWCTLFSLTNLSDTNISPRIR